MRVANPEPKILAEIEIMINIQISTPNKPAALWLDAFISKISLKLAALRLPLAVFSKQRKEKYVINNMANNKNNKKTPVIAASAEASKEITMLALVRG